MQTKTTTSEKPNLSPPILTWALIGIVTGALLPFFLNLADTLGRNIPQHIPHDITFDYICGLSWAAILTLSIFFWPVPTRHKIPLISIWAIKCFVTLGVMLFYEAMYDTDSFGLFDVPRHPDYFLQSEWLVGTGTFNTQMIGYWHHQIFPESFHMLKVSFSMAGLIACYLFFCAATLHLKKENIRILFILSLFPSILFWSSVLGKDPVVMLGIALFALGTIGFYQSKKLRYFIFSLSGLFIIYSIRPWTAIIMVTPLLLILLIYTEGFINKVSILAIVTGLFLMIPHFTMGLPILEVQTQEQFFFHLNGMARSWSQGGSAQVLDHKLSSFTDLIIFIPKGGFASLYRPLPGELNSPFGFLAGVENLFLLALTCLAIKRTKLKELADPVLLWAILTVLSWGAIYSIISYQNLGAAVRFKLQILPFLLGVILYLSQKRGHPPNS